MNSRAEYATVEAYFQQLPFSFVYGGRPSAELLPSWGRQEKVELTPDGRERRIITFTDPSTRMEMRAEITRCSDFPAIDWVLRFTNRGQTDSPLLEQVLPLNLTVGVPSGDVVLHHAYGSTATATDFIPIDEPLVSGAVVGLAPRGGRSSNGVLPFFNLEWPQGGIAWAIGWSGQWSQQVQRIGAATIGIKAGQQVLRATLHPGESVRTPRILLLSWRGSDSLRGDNQLRRLLLAHYVPRRGGQIVMPPVTQNSWFTENFGNGTTEENQLDHIRALPALGVEAWWLDAGWFEGGWPSGVGSWVPNATHFPHGLRPLGDEAHRLGLKFLVWFEPERVNPKSLIAREHPEFVLGLNTGPMGDGLFNLGDPTARAWMTDMLSKRIGDSGIDIYRTDFNVERPLTYWKAADGPDRQGITENHYIEGLYSMWDELLRRHPNLVFDDCASGGRRIDLEMISRSYSISRSDSIGAPYATAEWDQAQTAGLSRFVPLNATLTTCGLPGYQELNLYALRSAATSGFGICQENFAQGFPTDLFKKVIAEVKMLRPLYLGDFYPLTSVNVNNEAWCAWQFDRPELGRGFAMFFRRPKSPNPVIEVSLHGLDPEAEYEVTFVDSAETRRLTGAYLAKLRLEIASAPGSALVMYQKLER
jgi:alpha-galactosidase